MPKYTIKTKNENPAESIIEKTDFAVEFTINDLEQNIKRHSKYRTEIEAKMKVSEAQIVNVLRTNPEVEVMDEKTLIAACFYYEAKSFIKTANLKLEEIDNQIKLDRDEAVDILNQTGGAGMVDKTNPNAPTIVFGKAPVKKFTGVADTINPEEVKKE